MLRLSTVTAALLLLGSAACDVATPSPDAVPTISFLIVEGDGQSGLAGTELPLPVVVKAVDAGGRAIRGQLVNFRVQTGGGSMYAGAAITNQQGLAQDYWTLGPGAGSQTVAVVAVDPTTGTKLNFGTFAATALAPAQLEITPQSHAFGAVNLGASSTRAFVITNTGGFTSGTLAIAMSGPEAGDFAVSLNTCTGNTLAAAATCGFSVTFTPGASGSRAATVTASASPGGSAQAALSGSGIVVPALTINPVSYNFGPVPLGAATAPHTFTVQNPTVSTPAYLVQFAVTGASAAEFSILGGTCSPGMTLYPGGTCTLAVNFHPATAGAQSATLLATPAPGMVAGSSALTGTGSITPAFALTPASKAFGTVQVGSSSVSQQFTVQNTGGGPSSALTVALTGSHPGDFFLIADTCTGAALTAGATCTISAAFAPTTGGPRNGQLAVSATAGGTASAALSGTGSTSSQIVVSPATLDFGYVPLGSPPQSLQVTVTNTGAASSGAITTGFGSGSSPLFQRSLNCEGTVLAPGGSCVLTVTFASTEFRANTATLIVYEALVVKGSVTITGTGVAP